jgi:hypothetical protein
MNFISCYEWFNHSQAQGANFSYHVVSNLRRITPYLQYNQMTTASSILAVNLGLIHLSDRLMNVASNYFQSNDIEEHWLTTGQLIFKECFCLEESMLSIN